MTFGSLFAGIGGMDLGLERAGMECKWQVEINPFCQKVLTKHWPKVPKYGDITKLDGSELERVDIIAGGFPCQDVSHAGQRAGLEGVRSRLWAEFARAIRQLQPRYVLVENVTGLLVRGFGDVVGDLAASGYDAEWDCIPAAAVGAPHVRARVFVVAHRRGVRSEAQHAVQAGWAQPQLCAWWDAEPGVDRVAHGVPRRLVGRLHAANRALGNAVVPQVAQLVGERIMRAAA